MPQCIVSKTPTVSLTAAQTTSTHQEDGDMANENIKHRQLLIELELEIITN